uniref:SKA complex subunit 1 n=1 Tax=Kryptolebias marmoratus TaxID=37003 RepID=A0A3Q3GQE2_KRYMA
MIKYYPYSTCWTYHLLVRHSNLTFCIPLNLLCKNKRPKLVYSFLHLELPLQKTKKLGQELFVLGRLLEEFERCVELQKQQLKHLKVQYLVGLGNQTNISTADDWSLGIKAVMNHNQAADVQTDQAENVKTSRNFVKEMEYVTMPQFESIPQYMKGRVTYDQLNVAVDSLNTAVTAKYKILSQSMKTLNNHSRKLQQRFKNQETKDTKGWYFVVEDDIREFTQMKVDKRFQGILNMLRHCQRLRELRGGGFVRYVFL